MALKPCRECGTEVSTSALRCPKCGTGNPTMSEKQTKASSVAIGVGCFAPLALGLLALLWLAC